LDSAGGLPVISTVLLAAIRHFRLGIALLWYLGILLPMRPARGVDPLPDQTAAPSRISGFPLPCRRLRSCTFSY